MVKKTIIMMSLKEVEELLKTECEITIKKNYPSHPNRKGVLPKYLKVRKVK